MKTHDPFIPTSEKIKIQNLPATTFDPESYEHKDQKISQLELELSRLQKSFEDFTKQHETLQGDSRRMGIFNDDLQTSIEGLQTSNNEYIAVNLKINALHLEATLARDYAESIIETIREPLLILDRKLIVQSANTAFFQTFNHSTDSTEGKSVFEIGDAYWSKSLSTLFRVLPSESSVVNYEVPYTIPGLGNRTLLLNAREIKRQGDQENLILLVIEDVTLRIKLQREKNELLQRFKDLVSQAPVAICVLKGKNFKIQIANTFYLKLMQKDESIIGEELFKIMPELKKQGIQKLLNIVMASGKAFHDDEVELLFPHNNAINKYYYNLVYQPMFESGKEASGIIVVVSEVTEQVHLRRNKLEIQQLHNDMMEDKVLQRTSELLESNNLLSTNINELARKNKELESFNFISSHDLQEPLRKIQMFAGRIIDGEENNPLSPAAKSHFLRIQSAAWRMQTLLEDLLAYSRAGISELVYQKTELSSIVQDVMDELMENILHCKATIKVGSLCEISINPSQFKQVLINIIGNSLKYAQENVPPVISISSTRIKGRDVSSSLVKEAEYCHITISDNGIGFDNKYNRKIFEVFQRLHAKGDYEGTGIGLAIVKKIIDNHHGIIRATSQVGVGTTFDIFVPAENSITDFE